METRTETITYVALVVGTVDVFAIPARREEGLGAHAQALLAGQLVTIERVRGPQALVVDRTMLIVGRVQVRTERITHNHAETSRRRNGRSSTVTVPSPGLVVACTRQVVGSLRCELADGPRS